jgi:hypothetical protein
LCGVTLSCGSLCKHGTIHDCLFKRSPLDSEKGSLAFTGSLGTKKLLNKTASTKTYFKDDFLFLILIYNAILLHASNSYVSRLYLRGREGCSVLHSCFFVFYLFSFGKILELKNPIFSL